MKSKVNIIIRTKNEGKWLPLCINKLMLQNYDDYTITIVDSGSTDLTLSIVEQYGFNLIQIDEFKPGNAINIGVLAENDSEYFVCLSAHCVPVSNSWLNNLVEMMDYNKSLAGVFGRQVPMNFTSSDNFRDLFVTFPEKSYFGTRNFFHNANSIVRKSVWDEIPFHAETPHIEDILWAKSVVSLGWEIGYSADAAVTHFHGPNQHQDKQSFRSEKLSSILLANELSSCVSLKQIVSCQKNFLRKVFLGHSDEARVRFGTKSSDILSIKELTFYNTELSIKQILLHLLAYLRENSPKTHAIQLFDENATNHELKLMENFFWDNFPDCALPVKKDYGNYWRETETGIEQVQFSMENRADKSAILRSRILRGSTFTLNSLVTGGGNPQNPVPVDITID